ncbi:hypothetical protein Tco_1319622 [Tanacetum coccineum]
MVASSLLSPLTPCKLPYDDAISRWEWLYKSVSLSFADAVEYSIESFASWMINPGPSDINQSILDKVLKVNEAIIVHWKGVQVSWATIKRRKKKKQDKDATLQDFDGALGFTVRGDGVAIPSDAVKA